MLKNIKQSDLLFIKPVRAYGCYFLCLAQASPVIFKGEEGIQRLNGIWSKATEEGLISGDLNHDGDVDDTGEAEIQKVSELAKRYFNLNLKYDGVHHKGDEKIPSDVKLVIGQYWWKGGHFVIINKSKKVIFDSYGESNTVRNGYLKTMRWFFAA